MRRKIKNSNWNWRTKSAHVDFRRGVVLPRCLPAEEKEMCGMFDEKQRFPLPRLHIWDRGNGPYLLGQPGQRSQSEIRTETDVCTVTGFCLVTKAIPMFSAGNAQTDCFPSFRTKASQYQHPYALLSLTHLQPQHDHQENRGTESINNPKSQNVLGPFT